MRRFWLSRNNAASWGYTPPARPSPARHPRLNPQAENSLQRNAAPVSFVCMRNTPPHEMQPRLRLALPHLPTHCSSLLSFAKSICLRRAPFLLARSRRAS
jgi:hypothetical protein